MQTSASSTDIIRRNNVTFSGRGTQPMVFAHGFGCDQHMWRLVAPAFEDDYRVIQFDYVGSGRSDMRAYDPDRYATLEGYAQDIVDIVTALDLHDVMLVAHSVSSMIGALAAIREPERFARLIMISPSPRYVNDGPDYVGGFERADLEGLLEMMEHNYIGWANYLAPVIMKNDDRPGLTAELTGSFCSTDPQVSRRFASATFFADNRADLQDVQTPTLVIQVADDALAPVSVGDFVHRSLPNSTFQLLDATGHCPHMSHPIQTIEAMRAYLAAPVRQRE